MKLEKVYDELYGMIEDLKRKIGAGGSEVTITPTLESGEKVADYSIDGTEGCIYAPPVPNIYGSDEVIVGYSGADPVYCKRVDIAALPSSATTGEYEHSIADIDTILAADVYIRDPSGSVYNSNSIGIAGSSFSAQYSVMAWAGKSKIYVMVGTDRSTWSATVYLRYTKTPPTEAKKNKKKSEEKNNGKQ